MVNDSEALQVVNSAIGTLGIQLVIKLLEDPVFLKNISNLVDTIEQFSDDEKRSIIASARQLGGYSSPFQR